MFSKIKLRGKCLKHRQDVLTISNILNMFKKFVGCFKFFFKKDFLGETEEMDGRDGTDESTRDTTSLAEIEELKRAIRALLFVTKLSRVDAHKDKAAGWGATLKCASCPGCCGKKQEPPVQLSQIGARMLAGAAKTTAGSSCRLR